MLTPSELAPTWLSASIADTDTIIPTKSQEQTLALDCAPIERDITAWPSDAPRPPFAVGGVYRFADCWGRERTAHIVTEQHARVDGCLWHVSELPGEAVQVAAFAPDAETVADATRFAEEIINSQRWS